MKSTISLASKINFILFCSFIEVLVFNKIPFVYFFVKKRGKNQIAEKIKMSIIDNKN